ncbi:MAG: hypothetical protein R3F56_00275 [Planctomycetota bacterium]
MQARRGSEAGHASMEAVMTLPLFFVLLGVVVCLGFGAVADLRSAVAARHAAWSEARTGVAVPVARLERSIAAQRVSTRSRITSRWVPALPGLDRLLPDTGESEVTLETTLAFPVPRLATTRTYERRFAVMNDLWITGADREGLLGFLSGVVAGLPTDFSF